MTGWTRATRRGLAVTWTMFLLVLTLLPGRWLGLRHVVDTTEGLPLPPPDKIAHVGLFAGFSFLWSLAIWPRRRPLPILLAGLAVAVLTELGQDIPFIARDGNLPDGLADMSGVVVGVLAASWWLGGDAPAPE